MNSLLISRQLKFVFCIMGIDKTYSKALISIKSLVCSVIFMNKFININYKIETIMFVLVHFQSEQYASLFLI
jgi:hypothetical protein